MQQKNRRNHPNYFTYGILRSEMQKLHRAAKYPGYFLKIGQKSGLHPAEATLLLPLVKKVLLDLFDKLRQISKLLKKF